MAKLDKYEFMSRLELIAECRRLAGLEDTMSLYQVANSVKKDSGYVRVYSWADTLDGVLGMALDSFRKNGYTKTSMGDLRARLVLRHWYDPFVTVPTDHGFPGISEQGRGVRV